MRDPILWHVFFCGKMMCHMGFVEVSIAFLSRICIQWEVAEFSCSSWEIMCGSFFSFALTHNVVYENRGSGVMHL